MNNAVSNVAPTTICSDKGIGDDMLCRLMFAKPVKVLNNYVPYGDVAGRYFISRRMQLLLSLKFEDS